MNKQNKKYMINLLYSQLEKVNDYIKSNIDYLNFETKWLEILDDSREKIQKRINKFEKEKIKIEKIIKELENE